MYPSGHTAGMTYLAKNTILSTKKPRECGLAEGIESLNWNNDQTDFERHLLIDIIFNMDCFYEQVTWYYSREKHESMS